MAKEPGKLSALAAKNAGTGKHFDGGGLYLEVMASGSRIWRMKYRHGGKESRATFGHFPDVSLADARAQASKARGALREGLAPNAMKAAKQEAARREAGSSFPLVAAAWLAKRKPDWSPETYRKAVYVVDTYLAPKLRRTSIATLTTKQAADSLASMPPALASKARGYLGQVVAYAIQEGLRDDGRLLNLRGALPKHDKDHIPAATTVAEATAVVRAIDAYGSGVTRSALMFAMLTAARPGMVVAAEWSEIDIQACEWHIPATKMKTGHAHIVPLPAQALAVLEAMRPFTAGRQHVFPPLARQKSAHLNRDTLSKALRDMGLRGQHSTHGFRAMLRTVARERLGVPADVLEAQLAHAKKGDVQKAYDRTQFLDERKTMMQRWADYLDRLRQDDTTVVPIKRTA